MRNARFQMSWIALTVLGLIAGSAWAFPIGVPVFAVLGAMAGTPVVLGVIGLGLGTAQWPLVRQRLRRSGWWILASAGGLAVGLTLGVVVVEKTGRFLAGGPTNFRMLGAVARAASFGTIGLFGGAALGFMQWLVLRRFAQHSLRWIAINAASLGLGLAAGSLLADAILGKAGSFAGATILFVVASLMVGLFTARAFASLFPSLASQADDSR